MQRQAAALPAPSRRPSARPRTASPGRTPKASPTPRSRPPCSSAGNHQDPRHPHPHQAPPPRPRTGRGPLLRMRTRTAGSPLTHATDSRVPRPHRQRPSARAGLAVPIRRLRASAPPRGIRPRGTRSRNGDRDVCFATTADQHVGPKLPSCHIDRHLVGLHAPRNRWSSVRLRQDMSRHSQAPSLALALTFLRRQQTPSTDLHRVLCHSLGCRRRARAGRRRLGTRRRSAGASRGAITNHRARFAARRSRNQACCSDSPRR